MEITIVHYLLVTKDETWNCSYEGLRQWMFLWLKPYQADFASTLVALNGQFFQIVAFHSCIHYRVDAFSLIIWGDADCAVWARKITVAINPCEIYCEHLLV